MRLCIDLYSGLGGFSQAFVDAGWNVVRVDIERKFRPTICADVRYLPLRRELKPEVMLASPPCERFSIACRTWPRIGIMKAMELVGACFEAVAYVKPRKWMVENPMGRLRWFLGKPSTTLRLCDYGAPYEKKTDLWTNIVLPFLMGEKEAEFWVLHEGHMHLEEKGELKKSQTFWVLHEGHMQKHIKPVARHYSPIALSGVGKGKALRAKIPLGVSRAVLEAVKR